MTHMLWSLVCVFFTALGFRRGCIHAAKVIGRHIGTRRATTHERVQPTYDAILEFAVELDVLEQALRHFSVTPLTEAELRHEMKECGCDRCRFMLAFEEQAKEHDVKDFTVN